MDTPHLWRPLATGHFFFQGLVVMVRRLVWDQEAASSILATLTDVTAARYSYPCCVQATGRC